MLDGSSHGRQECSRSRSDAASRRSSRGSRGGEFSPDPVLGAGGFGITYLAAHLRLGGEYVVKEYFPAGNAIRRNSTEVTSKSDGDEASFRDGMEGFFKEAQLLHDMDHPNIVMVTDAFETNGTAYFSMPYLDGAPLSDWFRERWRSGPISRDALDAIFIPLLEGVKYIHTGGILHRDIKPDNIYVLTNTHPILLDFGAARQAMGALTHSLTMILTPHFAPIEQYSDHGSFGPPLDIYSLGGCLYAGVTGRLPDTATDRVREDRQPRLAERGEYVERYGREFLSAIDKALSVWSEDRFQDARSFQLALYGQPARSAVSLPPPSATAPLMERLFSPEPQAEADIGTGAYAVADVGCPKIAVIGLEGSGKTVLVTTLAKKLSATGESDFLLVPQDAATMKYVERTWSQLNSGRWPPSTPPGEMFDLRWSLRAGGVRKGDIRLLDVAGQDLRMLFNRNPEETDDLPGHMRRLVRYCHDADVILMLINIRDFVGESDEERRLDNQAALLAALESLNGDDSKEVAIVFTQYGLYERIIQGYGGLKNFLEKEIPYIYGAHVHGKPTMTMTVSAVHDAELKIGENGAAVLVPKPGFTSLGLNGLMDWLDRVLSARAVGSEYSSVYELEDVDEAGEAAPTRPAAVPPAGAKDQDRQK